MPKYVQEFGGKPEPHDAPKEAEDSCKCLFFSASSASRRRESSNASVQIEIPNWFSRVWRLLGLLPRLLEFFLQQLRGMLLRFHRLAKNRVAPAVLFLHGASRFFHVGEGFRSTG